MDYHTPSLGGSATLARRQHAKRATLDGDPVFQPQQKADEVVAAAAFITSKDLATREEKRRRRGKRNEATGPSKWALKRTASRLLPGWAVCTCMIMPIDGVGSLPLIHVPETMSGVIGGVKRCRSVWTCPYCASEITEGRREELDDAVTIWRKPKDEGGFSGHLVMATYTIQHYADTSLKWLVGRLKAAYRQMKKSANYRRLCDRYRVAGSVTTMELKHGEQNGWHPHFHELLFVCEGFDLAAFDEGLRKLWEVAAAKFALLMNGFGLHLTDCDERITQYIAKYGREPSWTEVEEVSKWHLKVSGQAPRREFDKHYTPFELLRFAYEGDEQAGQLFIDYAEATYRKAQMRWKTGFRESLGLKKEKEDDDFIDDQEKQGLLMAQLNVDEEWPIIVGNDVIPELKDVLATGDMQKLCDFLALFAIIRSPDDAPVVIDLSDSWKRKRGKQENELRKVV